MEFTELQDDWRPFPGWARYLIDLGYNWPRSSPGVRRIALISMPCDSAGAGLVLLGAMIRELGDPQANDADGHYDRLLKYAAQYLKFCSKCTLDHCKPQIRRCGFLKKASGRLKCEVEDKNSTYLICDATDFENRQIAWRNKTCIDKRTPKWALNYHIEGEPALSVHHAEGELMPMPYEKVIPDATIHRENLSRTFSGICLGLRASAPDGQPQTSQKMFEGVRLRSGHNTWSLAALLTIHDWPGTTVSRVASFNCRTLKLDRTGIVPKLVVADGRKSFLMCAGHEPFQNSDIIGVVDRNQAREELDAIRARVTPGDWYCPDQELLCSLPKDKPNGISVAAIRRGK